MTTGGVLVVKQRQGGWRQWDEKKLIGVDQSMLSLWAELNVVSQ